MALETFKKAIKGGPGTGNMTVAPANIGGKVINAQMNHFIFGG